MTKNRSNHIALIPLLALVNLAKRLARLVVKKDTKMNQFFRKILGIKPKVGDKVDGYLDFGIRYTGTVEKISLYYHVRGILNIQTLFGNKSQLDPDILVPHDRIMHQ